MTKSMIKRYIFVLFFIAVASLYGYPIIKETHEVYDCIIKLEKENFKPITMKTTDSITGDTTIITVYGEDDYFSNHPELDYVVYDYLSGCYKSVEDDFIFNFGVYAVHKKTVSHPRIYVIIINDYNISIYDYNDRMLLVDLYDMMNNLGYCEAKRNEVLNSIFEHKEWCDFRKNRLLTKSLK